MTEDQILTAVLNNQLFGAPEVDIKVPDNLKPTFAEMSPIFKNVNISRDDIGDHMRQYAVNHDIMSQPRKSLIGSMFGFKIMIITPLLKFYLTKGLVVTNCAVNVRQQCNIFLKTFYLPFILPLMNMKRRESLSDKSKVTTTYQRDGDSVFLSV